MKHHSVVHDPHALFNDELPLDRERNTELVDAVLAWQGADAIPAGDCALIALQLTGHARAMTSDIRRRCQELPRDSELRLLTETVLGEAERRLSVNPPPHGTVTHAQNRARLVHALYKSLDRLDAPSLSVTP